MQRVAVLLSFFLFACGGDDDGDIGDAGADSSLPDAGDVDAGDATIPMDAGEMDAGEMDAGEMDAGEMDAGEMDASRTDSGTADASSPDADPVADAATDASSDAASAADGAGTDASLDVGVDTAVVDTGPMCVACEWSVCGSTGCDPVALSAGVDVTCARRDTGALHCWGVSPGPGLAMSVGTVDHDVDYDDGGCAVLDTGELLCWSSGGPPSLVAGVTDAVEVVHTSSQTCIRRTDRTVACTFSLGSAFVTVAGVADVTSLAAGFGHVCVALEDGTARCWGDNTYGTLGNGSRTRSDTPVTVMGVSDIAALESSRRHVCARTRGGQLYCWGDNTNGQVGTGSSSMFVTTPGRVGAYTDVIDVACGDDHTCVARSTGVVVCWGNNRNGELGGGTTGGADRRRPGVTVVGISDARALAAGENHTCVIRAGGVSCWGEGGSGQLGNGGFGDSATPVTVDAPPD